ncbi:MAG TPA: FKBP-type peptidyl-prolyl cis-trans isomerase N-terminal domain-containing protein [Bacillota bacterium]|nr:FKBP-type peptidyl-prolyl cis-trans isomerase N-terminal domain-containing protein [Bacillota bacterium]
MAIDNSKVVKAVIQKAMETETEMGMGSHVLVRFYCEEESGLDKQVVEKTIQEAVFEWTPDMTEEKMVEMIMQNIEHLQKQIEYSAEDSRAAARNFVKKYKDKPIVVSAASSSRKGGDNIAWS